MSLIICIYTYHQLESSKINLHMGLEKTNTIASKSIVKINNIEHIGNLENRNSNILEQNQSSNTNVITNMSKNTNESTWRLEIPKIELVAKIAEGTTEEVLDVYIGHFEETQKIYGNIGLAAHNRGYRVNYFNRLKELEIGDEIIYTCFGESKVYQVSSKSIIEDTNWEVLENTGDNRLTLITCVENEPTKRRCVQAIEKNK